MKSAILAALPIVLLAGCATAGAGGRMLAPGAPATLAQGETVTLPDASTLAYLGVRSDSRCPPKVQCIQAGSATVAFRHGSHEFTITTGNSPTADLGAWRLTLAGLDFESPPHATVRLDPAR
ncbi:hypothetical protein [Lysobacter xanthus]